MEKVYYLKFCTFTSFSDVCVYITGCLFNVFRIYVCIFRKKLKYRKHAPTLTIPVVNVCKNVSKYSFYTIILEAAEMPAPASNRFCNSMENLISITHSDPAGHDMPSKGTSMYYNAMCSRCALKTCEQTWVQFSGQTTCVRLLYQDNVLQIAPFTCSYDNRISPERNIQQIKAANYSIRINCHNLWASFTLMDCPAFVFIHEINTYKSMRWMHTNRSTRCI